MKPLALIAFTVLLSAQAPDRKTFYYSSASDGADTGNCDIAHPCTWARASMLWKQAGSKDNIVGNTWISAWTVSPETESDSRVASEAEVIALEKRIQRLERRNDSGYPSPEDLRSIIASQHELLDTFILKLDTAEKLNKLQSEELHAMALKIATLKDEFAAAKRANEDPAGLHVPHAVPYDDGAVK